MAGSTRPRGAVLNWVLFAVCVLIVVGSVLSGRTISKGGLVRFEDSPGTFLFMIACAAISAFLLGFIGVLELPASRLSRINPRLVRLKDRYDAKLREIREKGEHK